MKFLSKVRYNKDSEERKQRRHNEELLELLDRPDIIQSHVGLDGRVI